MVNRGRPSSDCLPCRKRKLRCDLRLDGCGQCARAGITCLGYRTQEELRFRDQTQSVKHKAEQRRRAQTATYQELKVESDALLLQAVHPGWDVLAKQDFFTNFVFGLARSYDALGMLIQAPNLPDHLVASVDAASLAFFALRQFSPPRDMMKLATERYIAALHLVNAALADPVASLADVTLQSVLLLDLYEKLVSRRRASPESRMRHMNGAVSLIRARGKGNLQTYVGRRLTQRLYTTLVISCAVSGMRIPDEMERLRVDLGLYFKVEDDPKWALTTLNEQIINFTSDVQSGKISCQDQILTQASEFHRLIGKMEDELPSCWTPLRIFVGNNTLGRRLTRAGSYDVYDSLYFTQVRNVIRTARLNLLLMIERYAAAKEPDLAMSTRRSIETDAQAICDSLAQYLVSRDEKGALAWDLISPMQQLGTYTVLFPLYLATQASRDMRLHGWAQDVLGLVADVGGLAMAQRTTEALKQNAELSSWDVYTMLGSYAIAA
ncbi:C6 transcription factor [Cordyceps fumosorosea ARSEF 2679]|uniref:C6 transcription factor n=1 Tax=Cordyceps fumosorosea (strain ARSEF 2679) TaxID=1081104 RepID=A0A162MB86_CORFA|nr:C6 transcription factor [Cordyceps fumosorosea ARSEF 2679]OAA53680.1 C6 transcription factor [Cordyceps fumosorosea ARSEF 2679]